MRRGKYGLDSVVGTRNKRRSTREVERGDARSGRSARLLWPPGGAVIGQCEKGARLLRPIIGINRMLHA